LLAIDTGTYIPDNTAGLVDPLNHRSSNEDINTSTTNFLDDNFEINVDGSHEYTSDPTGAWNGDAEHDLKLIPKKWLDNAISDFLVNDATGVSSIAIGGASSANDNVVTIGDSASVTGNLGTSIGSSSTTVGGVSIGSGATSTSGFAIGTNATTANGVAVGNSSAIGNNPTSVGLFCSASADFSAAFGYSAVASGVDSLCIMDSNVSGIRSIGIGDGNTVAHNNSIVIGVNSLSSAGNAIAIGSSVACGNNGVSIGIQSGGTTGTRGTGAVSIGVNTNGGTANIGENSVALGTNAQATAEKAVTIGDGTDATALSSVSIGTDVQNSRANSLAFGVGVTPQFHFDGSGYWLVSGLQTFADNTAAAALATDQIYKTATGELRIKY
jgi:hypothetical protein